MILPSHIVWSQTVYYSICVATGFLPTPAHALLAVLGSMFPDVDTPTSLVGRMVPWVSQRIHARWGHRTITHSFLVVLIFIALTYSFLPFEWILPFLVGWISHFYLPGDMQTRTGVALFWPWKKRFTRWKNKKYLIEVGSIGELYWAIAGFVIAVPMFFLMLQHIDATDRIESIFGEISIAIKKFQRDKGENIWWVDIKGRSNITQERVDGRYRVIEVASESSFYIETGDDKTVRIGSSAADWSVHHITIEKGEPEKTTVFQVKQNELPADNFLNPLKAALKDHRAYLSGSMGTENAQGEIKSHKFEYVTFPNLPTEDIYKFKVIDLRVMVKHSSLNTIQEPVFEGDIEIIDDPLGNLADQLMDSLKK